MTAQDRLIAHRRSNTRLEVLAQEMEQILPIREGLGRHVDEFVAREQRLLQQAQGESTINASRASTIVVSLAALAVLFAALTAFFLSGALSRQIGSAVQHVQSSSAELQTTANQQATGARESASAMNEVSTTMSELLVTSRQILESAQRVAHIAYETAGAARAGDETVAKMQEAIAAIRRQVDVIVSHMLDLGKKSQQIGSILDMINEFSEQTNILSINATIEAAGAGEAGKRFAVVGDEIRKLAERVGGSTKEIRGLVEEIRSAVNATVLATEGGSKAVDAGLRHFEEVTRGYKQIGALVVNTTEAAQEIELGTKQQMTAVEQVNSAVGSAAQAARETETSTSQTLQTATQLAHLSHDLSKVIQPHAAAASA
jgi:methyl-accepting chemotaxis protein